MSSVEKTNSNIFRNTLSPFLRKSKPSRESLPSEVQRLQKVQVSTTAIIFQFRGAHNQYLYNRDLKITNNSGGKISFNIKSNNPDNYEVIPCRQSLNDEKSCDIRIRLALDNKNASKYNLDRFLVQWGRYDDNELKIQYSESVQLRVRVEQQNISDRQIESNRKEQQDLVMYSELLRKNRQKIKDMDKTIEQLEAYHGGFVCPKGLIFIIAIFSFLMGYFLI